MEIFIVIISWLLFGGATSYFASKRGRDPFAWFLIGMVLGVLGLLLLFILPVVNGASEEEDVVAKEYGASVPDQASEKEGVDFSSYRMKQWYFLNSKREQMGPSPYSVLRDMWNSKKIDPQTFVWCEGMPEWKRIIEIPQLKEGLE